MKVHSDVPVRMIVLALGTLFVIMLTSQPTRAAGPWYVNTAGNDANNCLGAATACATINGALNKPGFMAGDTVLVAIGTYTGTGPEVVLLDKDATLSGGWDSGFTVQNGISAVDGESSRRGITMCLVGTACNNSDSAVTVTVERFLVQDGIGPDGGGGIKNGFGTLTLHNSTISNNGAAEGGGILSQQGVTTLNNSTVSDNSASAGGGIFDNGGELVLNNSTVSGNSAGAGGGILGDGEARLTNSTVTGNSASFGGGIVAEGAVFLINTIVAANPFGGDCAGNVFSNGHNLDSDGSCGLSGTGDITNANPLLGLLADNGGPTRTHALLPGSPAIDAVPAADCMLTTDQRGVARPQGPACDIGAFELGVIQFADFTIELEIEDDEFEVEGTFTVGAVSDGIDPLTEEVALKVSTFSTTIPSGSFELDDEASFEFEGTIDGVELEVEITGLGDASFEFEAEAEGADLNGTVNPVAVTLSIGDDAGAVSVIAELEDDNNDDDGDNGEDDDEETNDAEEDDGDNGEDGNAEDDYDDD